METSVKGNSYLITGGTSLIGSHITDILLAGGAKEVRLLDNYSLSSPATIAHLENDPRVKLIRGDILKLPDLLDAMKGVDGVFALAGYLTLPMSQDPYMGLSVNTIGMANTLEACRFSGVRRVVFSSSIAAYGTPTDYPITEATGYISEGLQPASQLYGASKLIGEAICARYAKSHGIQFNALRFASVYGERQHARAVNAVFVAQICDRVLHGESPVIQGDGSEVHDYVYVTDVARACTTAMQSDSHNNVLNIATGIDSSATEVAQMVLKICGRTDLKIEYQEDKRAVRSGGASKLGLSVARAANTICWKAEVNLHDGIKRLIDWQKTQSK